VVVFEVSTDEVHVVVVVFEVTTDEVHVVVVSYPVRVPAAGTVTE